MLLCFTSLSYLLDICYCKFGYFIICCVCVSVFLFLLFFNVYCFLPKICKIMNIIVTLNAILWVKIEIWIIHFCKKFQSKNIKIFDFVLKIIFPITKIFVIEISRTIRFEHSFISKSQFYVTTMDKIYCIIMIFK